MLYKSLFYTTYLGSWLLPCRTSGGSYTITAASQTVSCSETSTQSCTVTCDGGGASLTGSNSVINCGNAGICEILCGVNVADERCLYGATINGQNAGELRVIARTQRCFDSATFNLPNNGNASFSMTESRGFTYTTITAASGTQNVVIDCTDNAGTNLYGDDCNTVQVHAQSAQFLKVIVGADSNLEGDSKLGDAEIYCPQNSNYNGPKEAPCIIDASEGGTLNLVNIYASNGSPHDVVIRKGSGTFTAVSLICNAGTDSAYPFTDGICYATAGPTAYPTSSPITSSPTKIPTKNPTQSPSRSPSGFPSTSPSQQPSALPTEDPTGSPSRSPSKLPSTSARPSADPSTVPSNAPSAIQTTESEQGEDIDSDAATADSDGITASTIAIVVLANLLFCVVCAVIAYFVLKRIRKMFKLQLKTLDDTVKVHEMVNIQHNTVSGGTVNPTQPANVFGRLQPVPVHNAYGANPMNSFYPNTQMHSFHPMNMQALAPAPRPPTNTNDINVSVNVDAMPHHDESASFSESDTDHNEDEDLAPQDVLPVHTDDVQLAAVLDSDNATIEGDHDQERHGVDAAVAAHGNRQQHDEDVVEQVNSTFGDEEEEEKEKDVDVIEQVNQTFGNEQEFDEGKENEDEKEKEKEENSNESDASELSDPFYDEHWAVNKVTNYHGITEPEDMDVVWNEETADGMKQYQGNEKFFVAPNIT